MEKFKLYTAAGHVFQKEGTPDELVTFLTSYSKKNSNQKYVGKLVRFNYVKPGHYVGEIRTVRIDHANNDTLSGHDCHLPHHDDYRQFRFDRIRGPITIL